MRGPDGSPVTVAAGIAGGTALQIEFADGRVDVRAEGGAKPQTKPVRKPDPGQGSLL